MSFHFTLPAAVRRSHPVNDRIPAVIGFHPVNDKIPAPGVVDISQTGL